MKKISLILAAAAMLLMTACAKEDSTTLDGTSWYVSKTDSGGRKQTCSLTLRHNGGGLTVTDSHPTLWNNRYEYSVKSYTFDGTNGTIELSGISYYAEDHATATFHVNDIQSKMYISTPNGSYTLDRM